MLYLLIIVGLLLLVSLLVNCFDRLFCLLCLCLLVWLFDCGRLVAINSVVLRWFFVCVAFWFMMC